MTDQDDGRKKSLQGKVSQKSSGQDQDKKAAQQVNAKTAPAPEYHPPGMGGSTPQQKVRPMETRKETERRVLHEELKPRVRGEVRGRGSLLDNDWGASNALSSEERFKQKQAAAKAQEQTKRGQAQTANDRKNAASTQAQRKPAAAAQKKPEPQQAQTPQQNAPSQKTAPVRSKDMQQLSAQEQAYRKGLEERGRKLLERDRQQSRAQERTQDPERD